MSKRNELEKTDDRKWGENNKHKGKQYYWIPRTKTEYMYEGFEPSDNVVSEHLVRITFW